MALVLRLMVLAVLSIPGESIPDCPDGCDCPVEGDWVRVTCSEARTFPESIPTNTAALSVTMVGGTGIPQGALQGVLGIRELTIQGNVGPIQDNAFAGMEPGANRTGSHMTFTNAQITRLSTYAFRDVKGYMKINFINSTIGDLAPYTFKYCSNITLIRAVNTSFGTFVANSFYGLNDIGAIIFDGGSIKAVHGCAFCDLRYIGEIRFLATYVKQGFSGNSFNNIRDIHTMRFTNMTVKLFGGFMSYITGVGDMTSGISMENCYIPTVPGMAFHEISTFNSFVFEHGSVDNVEKDGFKSFKKINEFIIRNAHIERIASTGITLFENVGYFAIRDMSIGTIQPFGITGMSGLGEIHFFMMTFTIVANSSFYSWDSIHVVRFEDVTFNTLQSQAFQSFTNIGTVNFTRATFNRDLLSNTFQYWSQIDEVHFYSCTFRTFRPKTFNNVRYIGWFAIEYSEFDRIETESFFDFMCLNVFSIHECDVNNVQKNIFSEFSDMERLVVTGNNMYNIDKYAFGILHNIISVEIDPNYNNFEMEPFLRVMNDWDGTDQDPVLDCGTDTTTLAGGAGGGMVTPKGTYPTKSTTPLPTDPPPPGGFSVVYIIVIVVVAVVLVVIVIVIVCCYARRKSRKDGRQGSLSAIATKGNQTPVIGNEKTALPSNPPVAGYENRGLDEPTEPATRPRASVPHEYLELVPPSHTGHLDDDGYIHMSGGHPPRSGGGGETAQHNPYDYILDREVMGRSNPASDVGQYSNVQSTAPPYESLDPYLAPKQSGYQALAHRET